VIVGLYEPGKSFFHRVGPGQKVVALVLIGIGLIAVKSILVLLAIAAWVAFAFAVLSDLGWKRLWRSTRPLVIWLFLIVMAHGISGDFESAMRVIVRIISLVWTASLVTHTTRLADMTDCLVHVCVVLRPLGVAPQRVAFMTALTLRLIPAIGQVVGEVREAQRARGLERHIFSLLVPVLTQILKQADSMSDALMARGYERWDEIT